MSMAINLDVTKHFKLFPRFELYYKHCFNVYDLPYFGNFMASVN